MVIEPTRPPCCAAPGAFLTAHPHDPGMVAARVLRHPDAHPAETLEQARAWAAANQVRTGTSHSHDNVISGVHRERPARLRLRRSSAHGLLVDVMWCGVAWCVALDRTR
jgi:hypothetical protein